jgi:hypothetical protein
MRIARHTTSTDTEARLGAVIGDEPIAFDAGRNDSADPLVALTK